MPKKEIDSEKAMELLGERVRSGCAKLYPMVPSERAELHEIVRKQWELEHGPTNEADKSREAADAQRLQAEQQKKAAEQQKKQSSQQDQDLGHSH